MRLHVARQWSSTMRVPRAPRLLSAPDRGLLSSSPWITRVPLHRWQHRCGQGAAGNTCGGTDLGTAAACWCWCWAGRARCVCADATPTSGQRASTMVCYRCLRPAFHGACMPLGPRRDVASAPACSWPNGGKRGFLASRAPAGAVPRSGHRLGPGASWVLCSLLGRYIVLIVLCVGRLAVLCSRGRETAAAAQCSYCALA